jgi:hypothetical protein
MTPEIADVKRWLLERKPEVGDLDPDFVSI